MLAILPVILSGGSGSRLWPLSREAYPKQFLPLVGDETMLQATWRRVAPMAGRAPIVVANQEHRFMAAEQLRESNAKPEAVILEPVGRNTAPAIAIAALQALRNGDALLLVLPSDHVIRDERIFAQAVADGAAAAADGNLVTFGVTPTGPETGYGYVKAVPGVGVRPVERFVEKPNLAVAIEYVASGEYFWNSGLFTFEASRYLEELRRFNPEMLLACERSLDLASVDQDFIRLNAEAFWSCPVTPPTMPSWRRLRMQSSFRWMPVGVTLVRGRPFGRFPTKIPTEMHAMEM